MNLEFANDRDGNALVCGDKVVKIEGYVVAGVVVAIFDTLDGNARFVVEHFGFCHIYSGKQLRKIQ